METRRLTTRTWLDRLGATLRALADSGADLARGPLARILHAVASSCAARADYDRAEQAYRMILRLEPRDHRAFQRLKAIYLRRCNNYAALLLVRLWLAENRPDFDMLVEAAEMCIPLNEPSEARGYLRLASELDPESPRVLMVEGLVLRNENELERSSGCFRAAIAKNPYYFNAVVALAQNLIDQGRKAEAIALLCEVIQFAPTETFAYEVLADLKHYPGPDHPHVVAIREMLERGQGSPMQQSTFHFILGGICDRAERYDEAFRHYRTANHLRYRDEVPELRADRARIAHAVDARTKAFSRPFIRELTGRDPDGGRGSSLLFIVGMPRSGSTLVEQILSSHPGVHAGGERSDILKLVSWLPERLNAREAYPECVGRLDPRSVAAIAREHLDALAVQSGLFSDKNLFNYMELGLITVLFPGAKVIHCRRNPLDTCLSCYFQNFTQLKFAHDLGEIGRIYREYHRMMAHWSSALSAPVHEVRYERMVRDPEAEIRRLIDYCGLSWEPRCLDFHQSERVVRTASAYQVKTPIYTRSIERWRHYERWLGDLRAVLGDLADQ